MSTVQPLSADLTTDETTKSVEKPSAQSSAAPSTAPVASSQVALPENTIGVREFKNNLTRIVSVVRNEQKEYIITVHGQPVAVLRPYTAQDAVDVWEQAADQEISEMIEMAKEIGHIVRQNDNNPRNELEKMREESACR